MERKQLAALFACSLTGWTIVQGLMSLLPVYAERLGADSGSAGNYMSIAFAAVTTGTLLTGWLSDKFQKRKSLILFAGLVNIPATWLMGQASAFWQLAVLTAFVWFFVGIGFTTISILAGLFARESERGKVFGILAMNTSLGALIGGSISGPIVDRWGYPTLFLLAAGLWLFQPLIALLLEDKVASMTPVTVIVPLPAKRALGGAFYLLLVANVLAFGAGFIAVLGRPLLMDDLGFDSSAISGAVAIAGAITLPFPLLLGLWSDRIGRYGLIIICFLTGAVGLLVMAASVTLWHFWFASILLAGVGVSFGVGPALVTDLVPPESLGTALSWYGFAPSTGGIIGFALTGHAMQRFGVTETFVAGTVLTLIAVLLVIQVQRTHRAVPITKPQVTQTG